MDLIKEPMYIEGKARWLDHLEKALEVYNNRKHYSTKMTPFDATKTPYSVENTNLKLERFNKTKESKFQVGDFVRVPDKTNIYSKGYLTKWNRELFKVHKVNQTTPVTYTLEDENGEVIEGKYYEQELLRSVFNFDSNNKTLESMNIFHKFE